jgi:small GTP-binding protein
MNNIKLKLILLGDTYTGKTSLLNCIYNNDTSYDNDISNNYISTIGVDFRKKTITKKHNYNCYIWDTSGQEKFDVIVSSYFRNICCALIVYDITNINSFNNIPKWINKLKQDNNFDDLIIFVLGNKSDLNDRKVDTDYAENYCNKNEYLFMEVSAKQNTNTNKILDIITNMFDSKIKNKDLFINKSNGNLIKKLEYDQIKNSNSRNCCNIL